MNRGCLGGLGRAVATLFFRAGALLASMLVSAVVFLILRIVGPLVVGGLREVAQALMGMPREGGQSEDRLVATSPAASYASLMGLAWVLGLNALAVLLELAGWSVPSVFSAFAAGGAGRAGVLLITVAAPFAAGAILGSLVHRFRRAGVQLG